LGHSTVPDQGRFPLVCAQPVTCHVDPLVGSPYDPEVTVIIPHRIVPRIEAARELDPIYLPVSIRVLVNRQRHCWPRISNHKVSSLQRFLSLTVIVDDISVDSENSQSVRPGFHRHHVKPGSVADENAAGLCHPPCAAKRNLVSSDVAVQPAECFRIDWLPDRVHESDW